MGEYSRDSDSTRFRGCGRWTLGCMYLGCFLSLLAVLGKGCSGRAAGGLVCRDGGDLGEMRLRRR